MCVSKYMSDIDLRTIYTADNVDPLTLGIFMVQYRWTPVQRVTRLVTDDPIRIGLSLPNYGHRTDTHSQRFWYKVSAHIHKFLQNGTCLTQNKNIAACITVSQISIFH